MQVLWTLVKVVAALALSVAVAMIVLPTALGLLGMLIGLAVLTLRLAVFGLLAYGAYRLFTALFGRKREEPMRLVEIPRPDPYYEAAKRELDQELGEASR